MKLLITQALEQRRLLRLHYNGRTRTVEPHVFGITTDQREALLCRQLIPPGPDSGSWLLCHLDAISNLRTLDIEIANDADNPLPPSDGFEVMYAKLRHKELSDPCVAISAANMDALDGEE